MSKETLLATLNTYDESKLQRLVDYADLIFIPEQDSLIKVTMKQMVDKAHSLADTYFPEWTDRSKTDFGEFLIEIFSVFSEKDFYYVNALINQSLLENTVDYAIMYYKAKSYGYDPLKYIPYEFKYRITFEPGAAVSIPVGALEFKLKDTDFIITNKEAIDLKVSGVSQEVVVTMIQGRYFSKSASFGGEPIRISGERTVVTSLVSSNVLWNKTESFALAVPSDKWYKESPNNSGYAIIFGDNILGVRPNLEDVITYVYINSLSEFVDPNGKVHEIESNPTGRTINTINIEYIEVSTAGSDRESFDSIIKGVELFRKSQGTIINSVNAEDVLLSYSEIALAKAAIVGSTLSFYAIPSDGSVADQTFLDAIEEKLNPEETVVGGLLVEGLVTTYISATSLKVKLFILSGIFLSEKELEVRNLIATYTDPNQEGAYGKMFSISEVSQYLISRVSGLQNIVFTELAGVDPATINNVVATTSVQIIDPILNEGAENVLQNTTSVYEREKNNLTIEVVYI